MKGISQTPTRALDVRQVVGEALAGTGRAVAVRRRLAPC
jgi:predicted nucleic acid-binding Zn finger protein